jgi:hypothetical protein
MIKLKYFIQEKVIKDNIRENNMKKEQWYKMLGKELTEGEITAKELAEEKLTESQDVSWVGIMKATKEAGKIIDTIKNACEAFKKSVPTAPEKAFSIINAIIANVNKLEKIKEKM